MWAWFIEYFLCNTGLKAQNFKECMNPLALLLPKNFAVFERQFLFEYYTQRANMFPSTRKAVCKWACKNVDNYVSVNPPIGGENVKSNPRLVERAAHDFSIATCISRCLGTIVNQQVRVRVRFNQTRARNNSWFLSDYYSESANNAAERRMQRKSCQQESVVSTSQVQFLRKRGSLNLTLTRGSRFWRIFPRNCPM